MSDYGIKISIDGQDIKNVTDLNLILSSKFNQFKIGQQNSFSITIPGGGSGSETLIVNHGLGYQPAFKVYVESAPGSGRRYLAPHYDFSGIQTNARIDQDNLYIDVSYPIVGPPAYATIFQGYYFIFKDTLA